MLQTIDLTKRYEDGQLALDALNLEIKPGEIFCLLGANGAGKTTTINLFLNFIDPTSGKAVINGLDVMEQPLETKKHVSFVSENVMLYGNFTARQNLDFFARLGGKTNLTKKEYHNTMREIGLQEEAFEKKLKTFSKGMRQKVGLAIAIIKDADNILMDEPTSGLDPKSATELMQILVGLRDAGKSILMCTHDIFRAKAVADRVGIMKEGRLVMLRTREEFLQDDLERIYLDYMQETTSQPHPPTP
jgi:ABC-2 type transport system ATP-binding protein